MHGWKKHVKARAEGPHQRRGIVAVQVAVGLTVVLGLAALAIDVGLMYTARAELQNAADAAALAAASQLGLFDEAEAAGTTVIAMAKAEAIRHGQGNSILKADLQIEEADIEFGFSIWNDETGKFEFQLAPPGGEVGSNAVRVTARRTASSHNGPVDTIFANIFGVDQTDIAAKATAILVPRDIMIVADLSGSYNDDSELRNYATNDPHGINLYEVWQTLPKSSYDGEQLEAWLEANPGMSVADAPASFFEIGYGLFSQLGSTAPGSVPVFGQTTINSSYNPDSDSGLVKLNFGASWNSAALGSNYSKMKSHLLGLGYTHREVAQIMADSSGYDATIIAGDSDNVTYLSEYGASRKRYDLRAAVALGLVYWNSGQSGGLWSTKGWPAGNGNNKIDVTEVVSNVPYPYPSGNWFEFAAYVRDASGANNACDVLPSIQHQFGAKTFVNFLLEDKELNAETDVTHYSSANPLNLTKNALDILMDDIASLQSADRMGLVTYGTWAVVDYPLPDETVDLDANAEAIKQTYRRRQAAHYAPNTNIGQGLEFGAAQLDPSLPESNARPESRKVIVLLTDGMANVDATGANSSAGGRAYALAAAAQAWEDQRALIYAIGVGSAADMYTLEQIADLGQTNDAFHADGDPDEIEEELTSIFRKIGGLRPTQLIE